MGDPRHVLVVEDQEVVRRMLSALLEARGYVVDCVGDGVAALERAAVTDLAVVVLDLMLPGPLDGLEVCRQLRAMPQHARTPVVVVSGRQDDDMAARVLAAGANRYLLKPFSPIGLLRAIEALTHPSPAP